MIRVSAFPEELPVAMTATAPPVLLPAAVAEGRGSFVATNLINAFLKGGASCASTTKDVQMFQGAIIAVSACLEAEVLPATATVNAQLLPPAMFTTSALWAAAAGRVQMVQIAPTAQQDAPPTEAVRPRAQALLAVKVHSVPRQCNAITTTSASRAAAEVHAVKMQNASAILNATHTINALLTAPAAPAQPIHSAI